jgi:acarbose 7IV-phosphotransferase
MNELKVFVAGGVSFNALIYVEALPNGQPQTIFSRAFNETVGGTGAGKAANLARLGVSTTLHATIGDDDYGKRIRAFLAEHNVHFISDIDPFGTERHVNIMDENGQRLSVYMAHAPSEPALDLARLEPEIAQADHVMINILNYCRHLLPIAQRHNKPIWCDLHNWDGGAGYLDDFIAAADYLMMSSDRLPDYRNVMPSLIQRGKKLVITTHGRHGATALTATGEWIETPAIDAYLRVDSNGAGDAFLSGVLFGVANGYDTKTALRIGAIVSGLCVTSPELVCPTLSRDLLCREYEKHFGQALPHNTR